MYTITITNMMAATVQTFEFTNYHIAEQTYRQLCDQKNLEIIEEADVLYTAGGIGHDYRIELTVNN